MIENGIKTCVLASVLAMGPRVSAAGPDTLDLSGEWCLRLDPADHGMTANWPAAPIVSEDRILLPNTTDRAGFGFALDTNTMTYGVPFPVTTRFPGVKEPARADEHGYLVRKHLFVGPVWYERQVVVPESWTGRHVTLHMERAMWKTEVWLDGRKFGESDSLVGPHLHELGPLSPGVHRLTVRVDNRLIHNLSTVTHAYGPETQTRWNGMIGALFLHAREPLTIRSVAVFPAADRRSVRAVLQVVNDGTGAASRGARIRLASDNGEGTLAETQAALQCPPGTSRHELVLRLSDPARAWDEFQPVRYSLRATVEGGAGEVSTQFGFRHLERRGTELRLNDRPVFLRGTLDCAVYPRTGHPPMSVPEWERVFRTVKEYGFNHVRFHTWCPPEAAFEAADRLGLYLQPEAPAWVDDWGVDTATKPAAIGRDPEVVEFLLGELRRMSEAYGNHPSFLLCAIGNEFGTQRTDWDRVDAMVAELKTFDPRRLYTACGARKNLPSDDYWFTHQTGADTRGIGPPRTDWDFAKAVASSPVPVIAHETGQIPVFPDYDQLLPKFTGPLAPFNLERYRRLLIANGLAGQSKEFVRASSRFQFVLYKVEHEAMLRTRGYSGYQLLMLNDFTGQSEALVGILDPFWESKGVVTPAEVRSWNSPTVVLARFARYVWNTGDTFRATLEAAHFGDLPLPAGPVTWTLATTGGTVVQRGEMRVGEIKTGGVASLGEVAAPLDGVREPVALRFTVALGGHSNCWNLWVFPGGPDEPEPAGVHVTRALDDAALRVLGNGGRVLLLAHGLRNRFAASTGFRSVYWSAGWWGNRFSALGVTCDPRHPALAGFPNEGHSDWQWHDLCAGATTFDLSGAPAGFRPIVQPVTDFHYNVLLGHVFEARAGQGSILVCGYDLTGNLDGRPAARQFRRGLFRYVAGKDFKPTAEIPLDWLGERCAISGLARQGARIFKVDSEDTQNGNIAANVLDGDPATFWHSRWQPQSDPMPHELVIDLGRERTICGLRLLPRQDQSNGRIARASIFAGLQPNDWGAPQAEVTGGDTAEVQIVGFAQPAVVRYLRVVISEAINHQPFAALAQVELIEAGRP